MAEPKDPSPEAMGALRLLVAQRGNMGGSRALLMVPKEMTHQPDLRDALAELVHLGLATSTEWSDGATNYSPTKAGWSLWGAETDTVVHFL